MRDNRVVARIVEVTDKGTAKVLTYRTKMCSHCPSKSMCKPPEEGKEFTVEVENPIGALKGDIVEIGLARGVLFIASFWAYLVPTILFIIGVAIGFSLLSKFVLFINREFLGLITGVILLGVSLIILKFVNNRLGRKKTFCPEIIGIVTE